MSDKKIKAATQEILEVVRKYDLSIFFVLTGRSYRTSPEEENLYDRDEFQNRKDRLRTQKG